MSVVEPPIIVAEDRAVALFDPAAEAESYLKPVDVTKGIYRGYDAMGRLLKIETDGSGARIPGTTGSAPEHAGELEELLRGFLKRVSEPARPGCDLLPGLVAACGRYKVETSDGFRAALFGLSGDLWRSVRGLRLRRRGN